MEAFSFVHSINPSLFTYTDRKKNMTATNMIMESVRDTLETFNVSFNREDARIVSGTEESVTGWISINYVLSNFGVQFVSIVLIIYSIILLILHVIYCI